MGVEKPGKVHIHRRLLIFAEGQSEEERAARTQSPTTTVLWFLLQLIASILPLQTRNKDSKPPATESQLPETKGGRLQFDPLRF